MKNRVYYNITKKVWSVQRYTKGKGWRVVDHAEELWLYDVTWKVYEKGRQRVVLQGRKNVHAYGLGVVIGSNEARWLLGDDKLEAVHYNPYRYDRFYRIEGLLGAVYKQAQEGAELVHFRKDGTLQAMGSREAMA